MHKYCLWEIYKIKPELWMGEVVTPENQQKLCLYTLWFPVMLCVCALLPTKDNKSDEYQKNLQKTENRKKNEIKRIF